MQESCQPSYVGAILTGMKLLPDATPAPKPRSKDVVSASILYAGLLTAMAVAQLFTFDALIEHLVILDLPGGRAMAHALVPIIIASEVFALPFLLRMALSPAFRVASMGLGWLVALLWLYVSTWTVLFVPEATTVGYLGTVFDTVPGWWAILVALSMGVLAAWAAWGMWPIPKRRRRSHH